MILALLGKLMRRGADGAPPSLSAFFDTPLGRGALSFLTGLALSTLFVEVCEGADCVEFRGPIVDQLQGRVFVYRDAPGGPERCVRTRLEPADCDLGRRVLPFGDPAQDRAQPVNSTFPARSYADAAATTEPWPSAR